MASFQAGPLRVHATGGSDRQGGGDGPAIVLCHGFGAPGDDLVPLARVVDAGRDVRWFFPEAPFVVDLGMGMTGRAWWNIDILRMQERMMRGETMRLADETPAGLDAARDRLEACLDALVREHHVSRERLILGGFSQGAMVSTEIALHAPEPFAGIVLMSGTLISAGRWRDAIKQTGPQIHALVSHGRADPLLPFEGGEALRTLLEQARAHVEWVPHNGQHEIPPIVLDRLGAFARSRFAAQKG